MLMDKPEEITVALGWACRSQVCGSQDVWVFPKDQMWTTLWEHVWHHLLTFCPTRTISCTAEEPSRWSPHGPGRLWKDRWSHQGRWRGEAPRDRGDISEDISDEPTKGPPRERINSKHSQYKRQLSCDAACQSKFSYTPSCPVHSSPKARSKSYWVSKGNVSNSSPFSLQQALAGSRRVGVSRNKVGSWELGLWPDTRHFQYLAHYTETFLLCKSNHNSHGICFHPETGEMLSTDTSWFLTVANEIYLLQAHYTWNHFVAAQLIANTLSTKEAHCVPTWTWRSLWVLGSPLNTLRPWQAHKESAAATTTEATDLLTISLHPSPLPDTHVGQEGMSDIRSPHRAQR